MVKLEKPVIEQKLKNTYMISFVLSGKCFSI